MSVIVILILASLSIALLFLGAFLWSVKDGQYQDDFSPAHKILFDSQSINTNNEK